MESLLNELRSAEIHKQYKVTQKDGLKRNPPLKIGNKDERPTVGLTPVYSRQYFVTDIVNCFPGLCSMMTLHCILIIL